MPRTRRSIGREVQTISRALASIARALARLGPLVASSRTNRPGNPTRSKRRLKISPERRASLRLQGRYMGHVRGLAPTQKAQVRAVKEAKGFRAAIVLAKRLSKR